MGASLGTSSGPNADLNLTPLIDIVLVVLIIMMVNIPIQIEEMGIKLPSPIPSEEPPPNNPDQLVIALYADGDVALNRKLMTEEVMFYEITRRLRPMEFKNVFIDADPSVLYGRIVDMVDMSREAGAAKVGLAKLKEAGPLAITAVAPGAMPRGVMPGAPNVMGGTDHVTADKALQPLMPSIQKCYYDQLAIKPEINGRVVLRYGIGPNGENLDEPAIQAGATLEDPETLECIEKILPLLKYPALGMEDDGVTGKTARVTYPILFSPG